MEMSVDLQNNQMSTQSLLIIVLDLTPTVWGLYFSKEFNIVYCIEACLRFANSYLMISSLNEIAIIGVTPSGSEFLYPSYEEMDLETTKDGQYDVLSVMNNFVRQNARKFISKCTSFDRQIILSAAITKCICYYLRRCRELQPTAKNFSEITEESAKFTEIIDRLCGRILIIKAADDNPSQYLSFMNAVFTAQKLNLSIDSCILLLNHTENRDSKVLSSGHSGLLRQAADLTSGIYLQIPRNTGLLQYLLSVFLPSVSLRSSLLLPEARSNCSSGVDFRAACFCHKQLIDIGYVCSICLSVFCEYTPVCSTCNSSFVVPNVQGM